MLASRGVSGFSQLNPLYPVHVRVRPVLMCPPLAETEYKDVYHVRWPLHVQHRQFLKPSRCSAVTVTASYWSAAAACDGGHRPSLAPKGCAYDAAAAGSHHSTRRYSSGLRQNWHFPPCFDANAANGGFGCHGSSGWPWHAGPRRPSWEYANGRTPWWYATTRHEPPHDAATAATTAAVS